MNTDTETMLLLNDGKTWVSSSYYNAIMMQIVEVIEYLMPGIICTAEQLCGGKEYWNEVVKGRPTLAGKCVADMARKSLLPLERVGCEHDYPCRYKIFAAT